MTVLARVAREPVLTGAAVLATLEAGFPNMGQGWKLAATAWVALFQRAFSTPKASAEERVEAVEADVAGKVEVARYVGAVEHQATALAGQVTARPLRVRSTGGAGGMPTA